MNNKARTSIPWWEPVMGHEEIEAVTRVIQSGYVNDGDVTAEFEQRLAAFSGVSFAVAVTSGTAALFAALVASGVKAGDEVIVPDVTFIATANAVSWLGAVPVLVDVDPTTLCIDPHQVKQAITSKTKAMIPVHVNGRSANMPGLLELAAHYGLRVIEDAAEALGASWHGRALGAWGDAGGLSFASSKLITTGQGGAILTNNAQVYDRLRELKDQGRRTRGTGGADAHPVVGYNLKFTNLQAAIGLVQLEKLPSRLAHIRHLHAWYREELDGIAGLEIVPVDFAVGHSPLWIDVLAEDRDRLTGFLAHREIGTRKFWHPLHTLPPYRVSSDRFPHSTRICQQGLWLPSALTLSRDEVCRISTGIAACYASRNSQVLL